MKNSGQTLLEYAIILGVIVAGLFAMQVYLKRGLAGKIRGSADELGGGFFYSPGATTSTTTIDTETQTQSSSYVTDVTGSTDYKESVMHTTLESNRTTNRVEELSPFSAEPVRWEDESTSE